MLEFMFFIFLLNYLKEKERDGDIAIVIIVALLRIVYMLFFNTNTI